MKRRSSYKVTFFDRYGADGGNRLRAFGHGITVFGFFVIVFLLAGIKAGLGKPALIAFTLLGAATLAVAAILIGLKGAGAAGDVARYVTSGGSSTPYEEQFSREQALVMQRDYAGALALYEERIAASPNEPRVRIAAADLYATDGQNPKRAMELYREAQRIPGLTSGQDVYVTNKIADLYLGPLKEPRRALVEFRRLIERYPDTKVAQHARMALTNLKADLVQHPGQSNP
jgi:tetratricopeptide (TPR) repeat protein